MSEWQPMETAPRDRPIIYRNSAWEIGSCYWAPESEEWWDYNADQEAYPVEWIDAFLPLLPEEV